MAKKKTDLLPVPQISKRNLMIVMVAFIIVGGWFVYRSFAAPAPLRKDPPVVITDSGTASTSHKATMIGRAQFSQTTKYVYFRYGTSKKKMDSIPGKSGPATTCIYLYTSRQQCYPTSSLGEVNYGVGSLKADTTYYFTLCATYKKGEICGNTKSFKTMTEAACRLINSGNTCPSGAPAH